MAICHTIQYTKQIKLYIAKIRDNEHTRKLASLAIIAKIRAIEHTRARFASNVNNNYYNRTSGTRGVPNVKWRQCATRKRNRFIEV